MARVFSIALATLFAVFGCSSTKTTAPAAAAASSAPGEGGAAPGKDGAAGGEGGAGIAAIEAATGALNQGGTLCVEGPGIEQWQDGVDTDCDGRDDPWDCQKWADLCGCPELAAAPETIPVDEACETNDLVIRSVERCRVCAGPWLAIALANRGQAPATGVTIELSAVAETLPPITLPEALEAGAVLLPINVFAPEGELEVTVRSDAQDCNPADNAKTYYVPYFTCK